MNKTAIITLLCLVVQTVWAQQSYNYVERSWNDSEKKVVTETKTATATVLSGGDEFIPATGF